MSAFWYIIWTSGKNRLLTLARRARSPRYAIALVVGGLYVWAFLLRPMNSGMIAPALVGQSTQTVVVLLAVIAPLRLRALFTTRVMTRLGVLSYSIYLIHWPLLIWGGGLVLSPLALATGGSALPEMYLLAGLSVGLSAVTYRLIERPFLLRKAHVGDTASRVVDPLPAQRAA